MRVASPFMRGGVLFTTRSVHIKDIDERWFYRVDNINLDENNEDWVWSVSVDVWKDMGKHIPFVTHDRRDADYLARGYLDDYLYRLEEHVCQFILDYKTNIENIGE